MVRILVTKEPYLEQRQRERGLVSVKPPGTFVGSFAPKHLYVSAREFKRLIMYSEGKRY